MISFWSTARSFTAHAHPQFELWKESLNFKIACVVCKRCFDEAQKMLQFSVHGNNNNNNPHPFIEIKNQKLIILLE